LQLLDYLDRECVCVDSTPGDKASTLKRLVGLVVQRGLVESEARLLEALQQREDVVSTGIGNGVAIPHADLPEIEVPRLAIGVFPEGVDFDTLDEEPAYVVFLLVGTPRTPGLHMKILARIARLSKDEAFCPELRAARTEKDVLDTLARIEARH
jgi:mannitol/fructose-specific phosphotransferase system IIA component (Ntr-type)